MHFGDRQTENLTSFAGSAAGSASKPTTAINRTDSVGCRPQGIVEQVRVPGGCGAGYGLTARRDSLLWDSAI
jgi:hypothetical protein